MLFDVGHTIRKLDAYKNMTFPIISVYIGIPKNPGPKNAELVKKFHKAVEKSLPQNQQELLKQDITYIAAFLETFENKHDVQTIAMFSGGNKLWEVITTKEKLPSFVTVDHSPYVEPITTALNKYQRYLIILADRQKAKLFTLFEGAVEMQEEITGPEVPNKVKGRGAPELYDKFDRHIRMHLKHHFDAISKKAQEFVQDQRIMGVVVGGHKTIIHDLESALPKRLKEKIVGEFSAEPDLDINDILAKSKEVLRKAIKDVDVTQKTPHFTAI